MSQLQRDTSMTTSTNGITPNSNRNIPPSTFNARRPSHPALDAFRRHSSLHYQSFPSLLPPKHSGKPLKRARKSSNTSSRFSVEEEENSEDPNAGSDEDNNFFPRRKSKSKKKNMSRTPIPTKKLLILAVIALAEQTAFNSISPYLPEMVGLFPEVEPENVGVSVGMIASAFAIAQFVSE
ncbi:hypothetical protein ABW19_dt0203638 [Dactylella cylindrospora]|nr:hypothetical protein ABW19_dt0203638 [Dactylella cylindrospora]